MPTLRDHLHALAQRFATEVLQAIRTASLDELFAEHRTAPGRAPVRARVAALRAGGGGQPDPLKVPKSGKGGKGGRLARRSAADIDKVLAKVVTAVKASKDGLRAEDIKKKLGLESKELPRVLKQGLSTKKLKAKGQKRATTYSAA
jgi:hypothetical protein